MIFANNYLTVNLAKLAGWHHCTTVLTRNMQNAKTFRLISVRVVVLNKNANADSDKAVQRLTYSDAAHAADACTCASAIVCLAVRL